LRRFKDVRARVDSGEFSSVIRMASRWTTTTGMEWTKAIMLEAVDNWLLVRTTTGDQDCLLAVNAFDVEPGRVATTAQMLLRFAFDSKGWLRLHSTKTKLVLDYEEFAKSKIGLLDEEIMDMFPDFLDVESSMSIDRQALLLAADHTQPIEKTGFAIKSAVHVVPHQDGAVVFGTDSIVGYAKEIKADLVGPLSIDASLLSAAISAMGDNVLIGVAHHRVEVSSPNSPARIQFSTTASPDPTELVAMFKYPLPDGAIEVSREAMRRVQFLCSRVASVDEAAEIEFSHTDGRIVFEILGDGAEVEIAPLAEGVIQNVVFRCDGLARALLNLSDIETYTVWPMENAGIPFWYIDGDGRHFMMSASPERFKKQSSE
jgi:hypothetical protein